MNIQECKTVVLDQQTNAQNYEKISPLLSNVSQVTQNIQKEFVKSITQTQLLAYNMSKCTTEEQLKMHFNQTFTDVSVLIPNLNGLNRGFGFVNLNNQEEAEKAAELLDLSELDGNFIYVSVIENCSAVLAHEINQELTIHSILSSKTLTEIEQSKVLIILYQQVKIMNKYQLLLIFDQNTFEIIQLNMKDLSTSTEQSLIRIIELLSEKMSDMPKLYEYQTRSWRSFLFDEMNNSGLIAKIESLIRSQYENRDLCQKLNSQFSLYYESLVRSYLFIMRWQVIDINLLKICIQFLQENVQSLIQNLNNGNLEQEKIDNMIQTINSLLITIDNYNNKKFLISNLNIQNNITNLIHFNCPEEIHCPNQIVIDSNLQIQALQTQSFNVLGNLSINNNEVKKYLTSFHSIISHLVIPLISFSNSLVGRNTITIDYQKPINTQYLSFINASLALLYSLLNENFSNCKIAIQRTELIPSLILLSQYNNNQQLNYKEIKQMTINIREKSRWCLDELRENGDETTIIQLSNSGYVQMLIEVVRSDRMFYTHNNKDIINILISIIKFHQALQNYIFEYPKQQLLFPLHQYIELLRKSEEQIEQEGGSEEIVAQFINKDYIRVYAKMALETIQNCLFKTSEQHIDEQL